VQRHVCCKGLICFELVALSRMCQIRKTVACCARTRGSARAFATARTHAHAFLTTGIDGRRVRIAMSIFAV
jgi:hypothetical protein